MPYSYRLKINGTKTGTKVDKTTPLIKAGIAVSSPATFLIIGRVTSIVVAPPGPIEGIFPIYLTIKGNDIIVINSLNTLVKKAIEPSSTL